jgi:hypothetical protein
VINKSGSLSNRLQENIDDDEPLGVMKGWVNKQSKGFFTAWKRKYLILDNKKLKYFNDDDCS